MAANNSNKKEDNLNFNIKEIKDICSKYKKYIATGAMLALLAVVISTSSAASKNTDTADNNPPTETTASDNVITTSEEKFEIDAYPQVNELFAKYYEYYAAGDTDSIEKIAFPISDTEKSYIKCHSEYVEKFENIKCYTKKGVSDGEFMVTVVADTKFKDISTTTPGLESFYVRKNENGEAYIDNAYSRFNELYRENGTDIEVNTLITEYNQSEDVIALDREVHEEYDKALEKDEKLNVMVTSTFRDAIADWVASFNSESSKDDDNSQGDGTNSKDDKTTVQKRIAYVKTDGVNMRKKRSTDSDVLQTLNTGAKVMVYGESKNGWYKVTRRGETGFVSEDYIVAEDPNAEKPEETDSNNNKPVQKRTAYIKSDDVNLRERRSTNSEVLKSLSAGTKVTVYGESKNGWYKVKCDGKTGFVSEDYVVSSQSEVEKEEKPESNSGSAKKRIAYAKKGVNMREKRSTDSEIIQTLKAGTKVMIYGKSKNGWFKVRSKGKFGYIKKEYIVSDKSKVVKEEETPQEPTSGPAYYNEGDRITLSDSVNVRQSMSEDSERVGLAYRGDVLTVIMSYAEGWTKVTWNGQTGYVKTVYLR